MMSALPSAWKPKAMTSETARGSCPRRLVPEGLGFDVRNGARLSALLLAFQGHFKSVLGMGSTSPCRTRRAFERHSGNERRAARLISAALRPKTPWKGRS
jgi:hypothetical protein